MACSKPRAIRTDRSEAPKGFRGQAKITRQLPRLSYEVLHKAMRSGIAFKRDTIFQIDARTSALIESSAKS